MSRIVTYTPCSRDDEVAPLRKKTPLTELVRAANGSRENLRTAQLTLDGIRENLVDSDSLLEFEESLEEKGIFGWLERRRKRAAKAPQPADVTILTPTRVFATSRR